MSIKNRQVDKSGRRKKGIYSVLAIAILLIPLDITNTDRAVGRVINDLYDRDTFLDKKTTLVAETAIRYAICIQFNYKDPIPARLMRQAP